MSSANSFASQEPSHTIIRVPVPEVLRQRCNRSLVLLLVQYIIYVSALIMTLIALGLLAHVQNLIDSAFNAAGVNTNFCFLYIRVKDTTNGLDNGNRPSCIVSLLFASIATVYLIILAVLGLVKLILNVNNKAFKILDIVLLAVTLPFVLIVAIIVSSGWAVTCASYAANVKSQYYNNNCETSGVELHNITMAAVFASVGSALVVAGLIMSVVLMKFNATSPPGVNYVHIEDTAADEI